MIKIYKYSRNCFKLFKTKMFLMLCNFESFHQTAKYQQNYRYKIPQKSWTLIQDPNTYQHVIIFKLKKSYFK